MDRAAFRGKLQAASFIQSPIDHDVDLFYDQMRHDVTDIINDPAPVTQVTKRQSLFQSADLNDNALHAKGVRRCEVSHPRLPVFIYLGACYTLGITLIGSQGRGSSQHLY